MPLPSRSSRSSVAPIAIGDLPELPLNITDRAMMVRWYADFRQVLCRLLESAANSAPSSLTNGLMAQAAYDADADGVVDRAKAVDYSGVTGKPATYPAASHQHPPSDVAGLPAIYEAVENLEAQVGEGVARISFRPAAVVPTSTMAPCNTSVGTAPISTSAADT